MEPFLYSGHWVRTLAPPLLTTRFPGDRSASTPPRLAAGGGSGQNPSPSFLTGVRGLSLIVKSVGQIRLVAYLFVLRATGVHIPILLGADIGAYTSVVSQKAAAT